MTLMALTSEERSAHDLCGAKKKNGEECRAFAGQGTDHFGIGRCKYHGGSTAAHKANAAKVEARREMVTMGAALDVTPAQALMGVLKSTAGHVAWLHQEIANLDSLDGPDAVSLTRLYADERDRLARVSKACLDSGIGKAEVEIAEAQAQLQTKLLNDAMSRVPGITNEQKKQFAVAVRREYAAQLPNPEERRRLVEAGSDPITLEEFDRERGIQTSDAGSAEPASA